MKHTRTTPTEAVIAGSAIAALVALALVSLI